MSVDGLFSGVAKSTVYGHREGFRAIARRRTLSELLDLHGRLPEVC